MRRRTGLQAENRPNCCPPARAAPALRSCSDACAHATTSGLRLDLCFIVRVGPGSLQIALRPRDGDEPHRSQTRPNGDRGSSYRGGPSRSRSSTRMLWWFTLVGFFDTRLTSRLNTWAKRRWNTSGQLSTAGPSST